MSYRRRSSSKYKKSRGSATSVPKKKVKAVGFIRDNQGDIIGWCYRDKDRIVVIDKTGKERRLSPQTTMKDVKRLLLEPTPYVA